MDKRTRRLPRRLQPLQDIANLLPLPKTQPVPLYPFIAPSLVCCCCVLGILFLDVAILVTQLLSL